MRKVFLVVFSGTRSSPYMTVRVKRDNTGITKGKQGEMYVLLFIKEGGWVYFKGRR